MAHRLSGDSGAGDTLRQLSETNTFVEAARNAVPVYSFHPLFREFLKEQARLTLPREALDTLRHLAAELLEEAGQSEPAAELLVEAEAWPRLAALIRGHANTLLAQGRHVLVAQWIDRLPDALQNKDGWIRYWQGASLMARDLDRAREHFQQAYRLFQAKDDRVGQYHAWAGVGETYFYHLGVFKQMDPWLEKMFDLLRRHPDFPDLQVEIRVVAALFSALIFRRPDHPDIGFWAERAHGLLQQDTDLFHRMILGNHLLLYYIWIGEVAKARVVLSELLPDLDACQANPMAHAMWLTMEAQLNWLNVECDACRTVVETGLVIAENHGSSLWNFQLQAQGAYGALTAGNLAEAREYLARMKANRDPKRVLDNAQYHYLASWEALSRGATADALAHAQRSMDMTREAGTPFPEAATRLALAQVHYEQGHLHKAVFHVLAARRIGRRMGSKYVKFACLLAEAWFMYQWKMNRRGDVLLRHAMTLGRKQGYFSFPWWRDPVMARLCARALEAGIEPVYAQSLIRRHGLTLDPPPRHIADWPWPIRIGTLGPFRLTVNDQPQESAGQKPVQMLKALIALGGEQVSSTRLMDQLWPDADGDAARRSFDTTLHRLRKLLVHEEALILRQGLLSLNPALCLVDVWALKDYARSEDLLKSPGPEVLLNLYHGHFLADTDGAEWAIGPREQWRSIFLRLLERMGRELEQKGLWDQAAACYRRGLETDDLAENLYRRLMLCLVREGLRAEAMAVYERCRRALDSGLGIEPDRDTRSLYELVCRGRTSN